MYTYDEIEDKVKVTSYPKRFECNALLCVRMDKIGIFCVIEGSTGVPQVKWQEYRAGSILFEETKIGGPLIFKY